MNIGGAVGPFIALAVRQSIGISYVLVVSSATSFLLFAATLLFYREPPRPADAPSATSMAKVLRDMMTVFGNVRFIAFLVIFSGFWAMFWHVFYALPFYVKDYLRFERFEIIETVDAWTIILVTVPVTAVAKRLEPLTAMAVGFTIATASWFVMASMPGIPFTVLAMSLFAIGEGLQSPRYYEYVAALAPKQQVGTYMGFAFLPIAIGTFIAGASSGYLVKHYVEGGNPNAPHMWFVVGSYGVVCTILMIVYDQLVAPTRAAA